MESARSSGKMKAPKARALNENVSPLQMEMDDQRERYLQSMAMSPFAQNIDVGSPLARYFYGGSPVSGKVVTAGENFTSPTFGSSKYWSPKSTQFSGSSSGNSSFGPRGRLSLSPLSSIENLEIAPRVSPPEMYGTPVKGDEEVLVMDDILVRSTSGGKSGRSSSSSSGRGSSSSSSSSSSPWVKRASDESGNSRSKSNSKCQIVRGKEDLHPTRLLMKSKSEGQRGKSPLTAGSGIYGSNSRTAHQHHAKAESGVTKSQPASPVKPEPRRTLAFASPNTLSDWSPVDDGIEVVLPNGSGDKAPSREEVDSYISSVLHGRTAKRRLPVFEKLCKGGMWSP